MQVNDAKVIKNAEIAPNIYDMTIFCPSLASLCRSGQFIHIKCGDANILRRPISVCDADSEKVRIVYEVKGKGTLWLSMQKENAKLDIVGPSGNGFSVDEPGKILLVGGGIGVPPMLLTAKKLGNADIVLGFRSEKNVILKDEFDKVCENVRVTTDDGTFGTKGHVGIEVEKLITENDYTAIYACGPKVMLRAVARLADERNIPCLISMEERMGCGVGACLVCACKAKSPNESGYTYKHVCKDGPVFDAKDVIFDD